jgi:LPS-assembly protein
MTFCAPGNDDWMLQTRQLELDTARGVGVSPRGDAAGAGLPGVLPAPWMSFPLNDQRAAGCCFPTFGTDSRGGLDVGTPLYLNLAPNYDLTYTPRYIGQRGLNHEFIGRYLDPWNGEWQAGGSYIGDDSQYAEDFPTKRMPSAGWRGATRTACTRAAGARRSATPGFRTWT